MWSEIIVVNITFTGSKSYENFGLQGTCMYQYFIFYIYLYMMHQHYTVQNNAKQDSN